MLKARRTETELPLSLSVTRSDGPVAGATAVVAVRDGNTDDSYLDFADDTFKTAGHTTRQAALADIGGGFYALTGGLDVAAITNLPAATEILLAEYEVTAPANAVGVAGPDVILLEVFVDDLEADVATLQADLDSLTAALTMADLVVAAGSSSIEVRTGATEADDFYNEAVLVVVNVAGVAARRVADYVNTNGAFTLDNALPFTPATSDRAIVLPADHFQETTIRKIETNRWLLDEVANEMTFFDDDGTTPLVVFDTTDESGSPSTDSVFERVPQ